MKDYGARTYGQRVADIYDEMYGQMLDTEGAVTFLAERAGEGPVLELGIGTGRVAVPLKAKGVEVHGIDASEAMVGKMREKPGGQDIPVTIGDFAELPVDRDYPLIYIPFNTFFALTTQDDQIRCLENIAKHLTDDGVLVIEIFVPDLTRFTRNQSVMVTDVDSDKALLDLNRHDPVAQTITIQHIVFRDGNVEMYPIFMRYVYPSELDLMARIAGLTLRERYENWRCTPFTSSSQMHVSVYVKS